ncbi:MAG: SRPBCC family protein [Actinomycetota bacterium]|nr:SRPBCC family protein [Actinomycetota bacterium]
MAELHGSESAEIAATVEDVFSYRLDFMNLPAYNPSVTNMRRTDAGTEPGPGAEYLFDLRLPGTDTPMETPLRVLEADAPKRIVFETGPGFMAREVCTFESNGIKTRAKFEITLTFPGDLDDPTKTMMEQSTQEQASVELELIKKALET